MRQLKNCLNSSTFGQVIAKIKMVPSYGSQCIINEYSYAYILLGRSTYWTPQLRACGRWLVARRGPSRQRTTASHTSSSGTCMRCGIAGGRISCVMCRHLYSPPWWSLASPARGHWGTCPPRLPTSFCHKRQFWGKTFLPENICVKN